MSNSFKLRPKQFSKGGRKIFLWPLFTGMLTWGQLCPSPAPSSPDKAISVIAVKSPLHKGKRWHSTTDWKR